jgi:hypothetical protein
VLVVSGRNLVDGRGEFDELGDSAAPGPGDPAGEQDRPGCPFAAEHHPELIRAHRSLFFGD